MSSLRPDHDLSVVVLGRTHCDDLLRVVDLVVDVLERHGPAPVPTPNRVDRALEDAGHRDRLPRRLVLDPHRRNPGRQPLGDEPGEHLPRSAALPLQDLLHGLPLDLRCAVRQDDPPLPVSLDHDRRALEGHHRLDARQIDPVALPLVEPHRPEAVAHVMRALLAEVDVPGADRGAVAVLEGESFSPPLAHRSRKIDLGMCMLTSMWGTSTVSDIFRSPASEHKTYASSRVRPCSATK